MWRSIKTSVSKRLKGWTIGIYKKVQGWYTKQANHQNLKRKKSLDNSNDPPNQNRSSKDTGKLRIVSSMLELAMQATGSKYVNNAHFDTYSGTPIGVYNRCSGCIHKVVDDFMGALVE